MDKSYPKSHVTLIMGLNMITVLIGLSLVAGPFAKGWYPGSFDTTVHVGLGSLIAALGIFRALLGYGSVWLDVVLVALGALVLGLPSFMHMQWNGGYTMAHLAAGAIVIGVAVISALMTVPVIRRMRTV
jgi:hypothetical protein